MQMKRSILIVFLSTLLLIFGLSSVQGAAKRGPRIEGGPTGMDFIKLFDTNKDGKIDHDEWESVKPSTVFREKRWPEYDKNRDWAITLEEAPLPEDSEEPAPPEEKKYEVNINQIAFIVKYDKNGDGKVDNKEFIGQHFSQYDKNSDGFIEPHEAPAGETAY